MVDGMFSIMGTSNLDSRSAAINEEIDVTMYDENFGSQMDAIFAQDLEKACPYTAKDFKQRTLWERFTEWIVIPFHSQM